MIRFTCGLLALSSLFAQSPRPSLTVFAASDLGPALHQIVPPFEQQARATVVVVLGSSGTLAQQIRNGAPADVFLSANDTFVDQLIAERVLTASSRRGYARGQIVIAALKSAGVRPSTLQALSDPKVRRIAIAN